MPAIKHARMQPKFQFVRERKIATFESIRAVPVVISCARALMTCECVKLDARTSAPVQQAAPTLTLTFLLAGTCERELTQRPAWATSHRQVVTRHTSIAVLPRQPSTSPIAPINKRRASPISATDSFRARPGSASYQPAAQNNSCRAVSVSETSCVALRPSTRIHPPQVVEAERCSLYYFPSPLFPCFCCARASATSSIWILQRTRFVVPRCRRRRGSSTCGEGLADLFC